MATIPKGRPINPSIWPYFASTQVQQTAEGTRLAGASYDWQGPADPFGVGQAENATPLPLTLRAGVADAIQHLRDRAGGILAFASRNSRKNLSKVFPVSVDGVMLDAPHLALARRIMVAPGQS